MTWPKTGLQKWNTSLEYLRTKNSVLLELWLWILESKKKSKHKSRTQRNTKEKDYWVLEYWNNSETRKKTADN